MTRRILARRNRMLEWPMVAANFLSGTISPFGGEGGSRLTVEFSYLVGNSGHRGEHVHDFRTEQEAIDLLRSLKQGPFYVRYDPASPSEYVVDPYRDVWVPHGPK